MTEFNGLERYSVGYGPGGQYCAIWGHFAPNILSPLAYLRKPKHMADEDWRKVLAAIRFEWPLGDKP
jgi:hypothetical protein